MHSDWDEIREAYEFEEFIEKDGDNLDNKADSSSNVGCGVLLVVMATALFAMCKYLDVEATSTRSDEVGDGIYSNFQQCVFGAAPFAQSPQTLSYMGFPTECLSWNRH